MRALLIALVFVCLAVADHVVVLDANNFDATIAANNLIMVEFYAPWCGHCKHLEPEYKQAAAELEGTGLVLAKVDADSELNRGLAQRFEIRGFPTIKFFRNGHPKDYEGDRTAAALVAYMKKQAMPALSQLADANAVETFGAGNQVVIVGFFNKAEGAEYEQFKTAVEELRDDYIFGEVIGNADANSKYGVIAPNVVLLKKFDEGKSVLGTENFGKLVEFVKTQSIPLIDEIGPQNYKQYVDSGLPLAYIFAQPAQRESVVNPLTDVARFTKGRVNWVWIDWSKYSRHAERLGLSGKVVPAVAIEAEGQHWAFDETKPVTTENVQAWVDQYLGGSLTPTVRSEEVPATQTGPIIKLVAKNFQQIVYDENKDVLVEFYAPWCGHCKSLQPTYEQLATNLKDVESIIIAQIDATANDVDPAFNIKGFPTLKFFPANDKKNPIDYEGDRSYANLLEFVQESSSVEFSLKGDGAAANLKAAREEL